MDLSRSLKNPRSVSTDDTHNGREPVVLVVGFPNSVHTARWINMVHGRGIRFVLVPAYSAPVSSDFIKTQLVGNAADLWRVPHQHLPVFDTSTVSADEVQTVQDALDYQEWRPAWLGSTELLHPACLVAAIQRLKPILIHSMVVQFGGYVSYAAKGYLGPAFPAWLLSNWGSDIYLFRKLPDHDEWIKGILSSIDAYHAECARDVTMVQEMGFNKFIFPPVPATGGVDFHTFPPLDSFRRPSERREIWIKGYHGWSGRGVHILSALHLAADALQGYKLRVGLAGPEVREMLTSLRDWDGLDIAPEPYYPDHRDASRRLSNARFVVGSGISDGISTTLLEAMTLGTFPIQGNCSCGDEWITSGETGFLVCPDNTRGLADAIRIAATDDALVDAAAVRNRATIELRWNSRINGDVAIQNYRSLIELHQTKPPASGVSQG